MGHYYNRENVAFEGIEALKPTICKSCRADGYSSYGVCETCLKNQAWNKEYVETHTFICDEYFRPYHDGGKHSIFKTTPLRMPDEKPYLYYGIEIEVEFDMEQMRVFYRNDDDYDDEYEPSCDCEEMLKEFSKITDGLFIYEKDGSLVNGVEFISRPMSYRKWVDPEIVEKIKAGMEYLKKHGAMEEQPNTNGMHIHISTKFFDFGDVKRQDRGKIYQDMDWLFQFYQPELEKIGGREYTRFCEAKMTKIKEQYGIGNRSRRDGLWNVELEVKGKMKKGGRMASGDHYSAVSMSGNTVEARIFNSTLDTTQILGNIELMRNFAHAVRDEEITGKTLDNILHTKENEYLDTLLDNVKKRVRKEKAKLTKEKKELEKKIKEAERPDDVVLYESRKNMLDEEIAKRKFDLNRVEEDEMEIK